LRTRSSQTPAGSDSSTKGSNSIAVSQPIWVGVAFSSTAAVSGMASMVTCPPRELIRMDVHSRRYTASRSRSSGARRRRSRSSNVQDLMGQASLGKRVEARPLL